MRRSDGPTPALPRPPPQDHSNLNRGLLVQGRTHDVSQQRGSNSNSNSHKPRCCRRMAVAVTLLLAVTVGAVAVYIQRWRPCGWVFGYTCFTDGIAFVTALNAAAAVAGRKLALICPLSQPCTISGTQLGREQPRTNGTEPPPAGVWPDAGGLAATVVMQNVRIQNHNSSTFPGALLRIGSAGSVTGTNLVFHNGQTFWTLPMDNALSGGCVHNTGIFRCTDCIYDSCAAHSGNGGGIQSEGGTLQLIRPVFLRDSW